MKSNEAEITLLLEAFSLMCTAKSITEIYDDQFKIVSKYVHATSRGHEAIQIALGLQLTSEDFVSPYAAGYRNATIRSDAPGIGQKR